MVNDCSVLHIFGAHTIINHLSDPIDVRLVHPTTQRERASEEFTVAPMATNTLPFIESSEVMQIQVRYAGSEWVWCPATPITHRPQEYAQVLLVLNQSITIPTPEHRYAWLQIHTRTLETGCKITLHVWPVLTVVNDTFCALQIHANSQQAECQANLLVNNTGSLYVNPYSNYGIRVRPAALDTSSEWSQPSIPFDLETIDEVCASIHTSNKLLFVSYLFIMHDGCTQNIL